MILLEILIAMAIVVLCIIPLVSPFAWMLNAERNHTKELFLDHAISLFYVDVIKKLHMKEIAWGDIQQGKIFQVDDLMWKENGYINPLPYRISYNFKYEDSKNDSNKSAGKMEPEWILSLYTVAFHVWPLNAKVDDPARFTFKYTIPILRHPGGPVPLENAASESEQASSKPQKQEK